jgi:hypothetical protein
VPSFLDLLYDEAPLAAFDEHLEQAQRGLDDRAAAALRSAPSPLRRCCRLSG